MRQIHRQVWEDSNGDLIYVEPENLFSAKKKTINLTTLAKGSK